MAKKLVVLAYSGGLDTSVILRWLIEEKDADVICFAANVGQGEELDPLHDKALKTGAKDIVIKDLVEEFAAEYVFPMLRANAVYEGVYLMGTSIARPLIAKHQALVAQQFGAKAVSHGATGKGNDQVRFELTYAALAPELEVIAPWREWNMRSRTDLIEYARKHKIPITVTAKKPYSMDRNLMHISFEGGILEDPWAEPPKDMFLLTVAPEDAPDKAQYIDLEYEQGNPVALNGKRYSPGALIAELNKLGGRHGIGRVDAVESRFVGMKSRGVYETPGCTILHVAHRAVESLTVDREAMLARDSLMPRYAQLVYNGFWFSPEREAIQALVDATQKNVNGTARVKLYKGCCSVAGRKSPYSLYQPDLATFEADTVYNQADASGFIRLNALRLKLQAWLKNTCERKG